MYDRSGQKHNAICAVGRARSYSRHYKNSIINNSPYKDSFKNSLRSDISSAIIYLINLL